MSSAMYKFQVEAHTKLGDSLVLVGSVPSLGNWSVAHGLKLKTTAEKYPLWWTDRVDLGENGSKRIEYKYVKVSGGVEEWEASLSKKNRWAPVMKSGSITVHDFWFGDVQKHPFGFHEPPVEMPEVTVPPGKLKIAILGSSVACGCNAWALEGWSHHLEVALKEKYGHVVLNLAERGLNTGRTLLKFDKVVTPQKPDVVVLSLSLGNEGLYHCKPHDRKKMQHVFESGIDKLLTKIRSIGAIPVLCGLYPNGDCNEETYWFVEDTEKKQRRLGVPLIDWRSALDDGTGRWKDGIFTDNAHPNTEGHRLMFEAIDLELFRDLKSLEHNALEVKQEERTIFEDASQFMVTLDESTDRIRFINPTSYTYSVDSSWVDLQVQIKSHDADLRPGLYLEKCARKNTCFVTPEGKLETAQTVAPGADLTFEPLARKLFSDFREEDILFYDGNIGVVRDGEEAILVFNETPIEYNIHPMWAEVRRAMQSVREGVYADLRDTEQADFRTLVVEESLGLASRFKVAPMSRSHFTRTCSLEGYKRTALIPLGHRCAIRMILHRIQYDGPCYPFDLTRTMSLADIADIVATDFSDMWNPEQLFYSDEGGRLYHRRWGGLSYAHEVEEGDDPIQNVRPILDRMKVRYGKRAGRFRFVMDNADEVLLLRTGLTNRGEVDDLMKKVRSRWPQTPVRLMIFSPQHTGEFDGLEGVYHFNKDLDPDRMNEDAGYFEHCARETQYLLKLHGVSTRNLFWCPASPTIKTNKSAGKPKETPKDDNAKVDPSTNPPVLNIYARPPSGNSTSEESLESVLTEPLKVVDNTRVDPSTSLHIPHDNARSLAGTSASEDLVEDVLTEILKVVLESDNMLSTQGTKKDTAFGGDNGSTYEPKTFSRFQETVSKSTTEATAVLKPMVGG